MGKELDFQFSQSNLETDSQKNHLHTRGWMKHSQNSKPEQITSLRIASILFFFFCSFNTKLAVHLVVYLWFTVFHITVDW